MSKGKKQACTLIALCVLLAAAVCLYFFVPKGESEEEAADEGAQESVTVAQIDTEKISSVQITGEGREDISLKKEGEAWKLTDLPEAPVTTETVEGMFTGLAPLTATGELALGENGLAEYGLDKPQMIVRLETSDGQQYELKFGQAVPVTGGNYGSSGDENKVYTFADTLFTSFDVKKNALITKEEIADIDSEYLTSMAVRKEGVDTFLAEVVPDDKKVDAYTNWVISKPYAKPLAGSLQEAWSTLQGYFTSPSFGELIEYSCKDMKKYGLEKTDSSVEVGYFEVKDGYEIPAETASPAPAAQTGVASNKANSIPEEYQDKKSYKLLIGNKTEDGDDYYVRLDGSDNVYTMTADAVDNMLGVDAYTYMDHSVYATLATDLSGYEVTIGKKKITVTHETEKGEDGKDKNVWTLNGTRVPDSQEEAFLTPYSKAYLLEFTSTAKVRKQKMKPKPIMTIVYHEKGRDVKVEYLPYDGTNFYRVNKDGMNYFLVDKRSVDDVVSAFESLLELDLSGEK